MKNCSLLFCGALRQKFSAFSLVEMLMALLVASLLLAALAPVITRRMNENIHITGDMTLKGDYEVREIMFGGPECPNIVYDTNNNPLYCEGEYVVPEGVSNITVTAIGGGGGGGTAPTAGFIEYTTAGSTNTFTVPAMVNQIEATLVSGGAGGGAGGQVEKDVDYLTAGNFTWNVPEIARNKNVLITACGGGGGGGGSPGAGINCSEFTSVLDAGYGGGGGYIYRKAVTLNASATQSLIVGGGGGGGGGNGTANRSDLATGFNGTYGGGGGGGGDTWCTGSGTSGLGGSNGGKAGTGRGCGTNFGFGGERGDINLNSNTDGNTGAKGASSAGGTGASSGGSTTYSANNIYAADTNFSGGGGGGGSITGYGGGGGGAGSTGGGGGGGGGATIFGTRNNQLAMAPGGGGGGAGMTDDRDYITWELPTTTARLFNGPAAGGGGGGGTGGGNGGDGGMAEVTYAKAGGNGAGYLAPGAGNRIFDANHCEGGSALQHGNAPICAKTGESGKPGAMRITYLNYGSGASGGGGGQIVPIQPVSVLPNDSVLVTIGAGAPGGKAGRIDENGQVVQPSYGGGGNDGSVNEIMPTTVYKNDARTLSTAPDNFGGVGAWGGSPTGHSFGFWESPYYGCNGAITSGKSNAIISMPGFSNTVSRTAGNGTITGAGIQAYPNETIGGDGGTVTTPWFICVPGKGGTKDNPKGGDAAGYGCGGGGGYGLANGGNGSGGYARISWNMYWDTALNSGQGDYRYADTGTGGGGAAGNAITETVRVAEKQTIKIRIGAGGNGAKVANGEVIPASPGGTTIFGDTNFIEIKAGGGGGGASPSVIKNGDTSTLINGKGGEPSLICDVGSHKYLNNKNRCTKGNPGKNPGDDNTNLTMGGLGGAFSLTLNGKTYTGTPGTGGIQSTEISNSSGKTPENSIASGGGGAALLIYRNGVSDISLLANPQGGNGANGRMILKLWK